jgi:hypothetical protein
VVMGPQPAEAGVFLEVVTGVYVTGAVQTSRVHLGVVMEKLDEVKLKPEKSA